MPYFIKPGLWNEKRNKLKGELDLSRLFSSFDRVSVNTSGNIDLDLNGTAQRAFVGSQDINANKTWTISGISSAVTIPFFKFTVGTVGAEQTMPSNVKMVTYDGLWDDVTKKWTPDEEGDYIMSANYDGTTWYMKINGPF